MTEPLDLLGLLAGLFFALCGIPVAQLVVREGRTPKTIVGTAWLIFSGAVLMYLYLLLKYGFNPTLAAVYFVEAGSWALALYYHFFPRASRQEGPVCAHCQKGLRPGMEFAKIGNEQVHAECVEQYVCAKAVAAGENSMFISNVEWGVIPEENKP